jgi:hypothetical protein
MRNIQETGQRLEFNAIHQRVVCADDIDLACYKENTETKLDASKEADLEVNADETECMSMPCYLTAGQISV